MTSAAPPLSAKSPPPPERHAAFLRLLVGQAVSLLGSSVSGFALGVWVYERSESTFWYGALLFALRVSAIVGPLLAGSQIDRRDRRAVMIALDAGSALTTLALLAFFFHGEPTLGATLALLVLGSLLSAAQNLAFLASVRMLVPRSHLGRTNGLLGLIASLIGFGAPMAGGALLSLLSVRGVLIFDLLSFVVALGLLLTVRIPAVEGSAGGGKTDERERGLAWGLRYIRERPTLWASAKFGGVSAALVSVPLVLMTPLVLAESSPTGLGVVLSCGALGTALSSLGVARWGDSGDTASRSITLRGLAALTLFAPLVSTSIPALALMTGLFLALQTAAVTLDQSIWQRCVDAGAQGRVLSSRTLIVSVATPVSYLLAGAVADLMEPAFRRGPLQGVAALMSTARPATVALMALTGLLLVLHVLRARMSAWVRELDRLENVARSSAEVHQSELERGVSAGDG